jgi:hypothetical protein
VEWTFCCREEDDERTHCYLAVSVQAVGRYDEHHAASEHLDVHGLQLESTQSHDCHGVYEQWIFVECPSGLNSMFMSFIG